MADLASATLWFVHTPDGRWFISMSEPVVQESDDENIDGKWFSRGLLATPSSNAVAHVAHEIGLPKERGRVHVVEIQQVRTADRLLEVSDE